MHVILLPACDVSIFRPARNSQRVMLKTPETPERMPRSFVTGAAKSIRGSTPPVPAKLPPNFREDENEE